MNLLHGTNTMMLKNDTNDEDEQYFILLPDGDWHGGFFGFWSWGLPIC